MSLTLCIEVNEAYLIPLPKSAIVFDIFQCLQEDAGWVVDEDKGSRIDMSVWCGTLYYFHNE